MIKLNLRLFAETNTTDTGDLSGTDNSATSTESGDIIYGKQEDGQQGAAAQDDAQEVARDYEAEFEALIKGDYKKQYDARVKNVINKRLKNARQVENRLEEVNSLVDYVGAIYGINSDNIQDYIEAMQRDNRFYEAEAEQLGIPVEQYREMKKAENENRRLQLLLKQSEQRRQDEQIFAQITAQAEQVQQLYPDFDFDVELDNPDFSRLINSGIDVKTAYEVAHHDEILQGAMAYTAQTVAKKTAATIAAKQKRPLEGGISSQAQATVKTDVNKLTKEDRENIIKRVMQGERIVF